jgi:uncharacterized protein YkwD
MAAGADLGCGMHFRRGMLVLLVMCALVAGVATSSAAASGYGSSRNASVTRVLTLEARVMRELNAVRATHGLHPFKPSKALLRTAVGHSVAMATVGFFAHESQDGTPFWRRLKQLYGPRTNGWTVGENLAMFGGAEPTAADIVAAWMASPGHRANVLRALFREAGVGVIFNPAAGGVFGGEPTWVVTLDVGRR